MDKEVCESCGGTNFTVVGNKKFCSTCLAKGQKDDGKVVVLDG